MYIYIFIIPPLNMRDTLKISSTQKFSKIFWKVLRKFVCEKMQCHLGTMSTNQLPYPGAYIVNDSVGLKEHGSFQTSSSLSNPRHQNTLTTSTSDSSMPPVPTPLLSRYQRWTFWTYFWVKKWQRASEWMFITMWTAPPDVLQTVHRYQFPPLPVHNRTH